MKKKNRSRPTEIDWLSAHAHGLDNDKTWRRHPHRFWKNIRAFWRDWEIWWIEEFAEDRLKNGIPVDDMRWGFQVVQIDDQGRDIWEVFVARLGGLR